MAVVFLFCDQKELFHKPYVPHMVFLLVQDMMSQKDIKTRQKTCFHILKILTDYYDVCRCRIRIHNERRPLIDGDRTLFGQYCNRPNEKPLIEIWNYTGSGRLVSSRSVLHTLLHEFVHHYDVRYLGLAPSHGVEFNNRLRFLTSVLEL